MGFRYTPKEFYEYVGEEAFYDNCVTVGVYDYEVTHLNLRMSSESRGRYLRTQIEKVIHIVYEEICYRIFDVRLTHTSNHVTVVAYRYSRDRVDVDTQQKIFYLYEIGALEGEPSKR